MVHPSVYESTPWEPFLKNIAAAAAAPTPDLRFEQLHRSLAAVREHQYLLVRWVEEILGDDAACVRCLAQSEYPGVLADRFTLFRDERRGFGIDLRRIKTIEQTGGLAPTPHTHGAWGATLILAGSCRESIFRPTVHRSGHDGLTHELQIVSGPGAIRVFLRPDYVHYLEAVDGPVLSLFAYGYPSRECVRDFDRQTGSFVSRDDPMERVTLALRAAARFEE